MKSSLLFARPSFRNHFKREISNQMGANCGLCKMITSPDACYGDQSDTYILAICCLRNFALFALRISFVFIIFQSCQ
jgi:hypothetical protein